MSKKTKIQINKINLNNLIKAKNPPPQTVDPEMKYVQENTMRAISNLITRTGEFNFSNGKPVPRGVYYHCHYTINFEEYFMTGAV